MIDHHFDPEDYQEAGELAWELHLEREADRLREERAGLHDHDFQGNAWCERFERVRLGAVDGVVATCHPIELAINLSSVPAPGAYAARIEYVPRAYRPWFDGLSAALREAGL